MALMIGDMTVAGSTGGRPLGDGPLTVLVHGAGMDRTVWSLQTRWLAHRGHATLAIDLPGHGMSPDDPMPSIFDYGKWLSRLVEEAAPTHGAVHLVGHSMGTFIALEAAQLADVASLTLTGTAASMPVHPKLLEAAEANDPLAAQLMSGWAFDTGRRTGPHPSPGASMVGGTQAMIAQTAAGVLHEDLSSCADYEGATNAVQLYAGPITFVLGLTDRMTPRRNAQPLIDAARQPSVVEVDCGHMMPIEAPRPTRQAIADTVAAA